MKNDFIITLNSTDTTSWTGSNIYDCNYFINFNSILSTLKCEKAYKITFSFKSNKSVYFIGKAIGLHINNITYSIKNQQNLNQTFLLGLLKTTSFQNYIVDGTTKEDDNPVVSLQGLNNRTTLSLSMKTLLTSSLYNNTLTGLGNLINYYRFYLGDINLGSVYNYKTLNYDGILQNGANITTNEILDLTPTTSYISIPSFDWSLFATLPITFSCWYNSSNTNAFTLFAINKTRLTINNNTIIGYFNGNSTTGFNATTAGINLTSGKWFHIVWVFGNVASHKLFINGFLVSTATNTDFTATALETLTYLGKNRTTANYINGYMSNVRF